MQDRPPLFPSPTVMRLSGRRDRGGDSLEARDTEK